MRSIVFIALIVLNVWPVYSRNTGEDLRVKFPAAGGVPNLGTKHGARVNNTSSDLADLMAELRKAYYNVTNLSIDGQPGETELDRYYNFQDAINEYLRLVKLAHGYLDSLDVGEHREDAERVNHVASRTERERASNGSTSAGSAVIPKSSNASETEIDANTRTSKRPDENHLLRVFRRQLRTIESSVERDPTLSQFLSEYLDNSANQTGQPNRNFEFYEDFVRYTNFGRLYVQNISLINESTQVFNQIYSHLTSIYFPNNVTRPSRQYQMIRRMSVELYVIRRELMQKVASRIRENRRDVIELFEKLDKINKNQPYIRMLGDEFTLEPPYFSANVRQIGRLLDLYLTNSLTEFSFYNQLSELPEDFIALGATIAHDYENRELPRYNRFQAPNYQHSWPSFAAHLVAIGHARQSVQQAGQQTQQYPQQQLRLLQQLKNATQHTNPQETLEARRSNLSLLTRLFSSG